MMIAGPIHPPFSFPSCGKENGPWTVQKKRPLFCRAPVQWPSARTGVSRIGAGKDCRPSAGSRRAAHLSQLCAACPARRKTGRKIAWPLLLFPLPLFGPAKGLSNGRTHRSAPTEGKSPQRFVGADLSVGPCPAREGQRQRLCRLMLDSRSRLRRITDVASPLRGDAAYPLRVKAERKVSGTSPGLDDPKGSAFSSLAAVREGQPSPAVTFFLFHRAVAQPLAALPPYAGQPFAASPRYGCRVPLAGRCGIPLAGTAHLSPPKSRRKRRLAPTRVCRRSLFDVSNRGPRRKPAKCLRWGEEAQRRE